jgi:hypothetical protein
MSDEKHQERAETEELLELPPTIENLDAKMNHVITHLYLTEQLCNRAATSSEAARKTAEDSRVAAVKAADTALKAIQTKEPLSRKERFGAVFAGAAAGGALAQLMLYALGIGSAAAVISSCGH